MKKKILLVDDKSTIGKVAGVYLGKEYDCPNKPMFTGY